MSTLVVLSMKLVGVGRDDGGGGDHLGNPPWDALIVGILIHLLSILMDLATILKRSDHMVAWGNCFP